MGNGLTPGPTNEHGDHSVIDEGTLARTGSPSPGAIGLDASTHNPKPNQPSVADQILSFTRRRRGQRVGDGECFTLADKALRTAGAKSASDYGSITPGADYTWGTSVGVSNVRPGDVIQFRNYRYDRRIETNNPDGSEKFATDFQERPHHTAIVESVAGNGAITVLEQNSPKGSAVVRNTLFFSDSTTTHGNTTTTITVQGTFWFYRPQAP